MPKGPQGQKRPGDVIGAAIMVAKIATGEVDDDGAAPKKQPPRIKPSSPDRGEAKADKR
jgi:hypothetical protein